MYFSYPLTPDKLTAAEQLIIEYITGHRDEFLCMTIGQLSDELNLSEATISRFARHVGCCDFKHLKRIIMEQTVQKGPAQKLKNTLQTSADNLLNDWIEQQQYYLQKTLELLDQGEFSRAVDAIGVERRVLFTQRKLPGHLHSFWNFGFGASGLMFVVFHPADRSFWKTWRL